MGALQGPGEEDMAPLTGFFLTLLPQALPESGDNASSLSDVIRSESYRTSSPNVTNWISGYLTIGGQASVDAQYL